jgi:hypothetical protein
MYLKYYIQLISGYNFYLIFLYSLSIYIHIYTAFQPVHSGTHTEKQFMRTGKVVKSRTSTGVLCFDTEAKTAKRVSGQDALQELPSRLE